MDCIEGVKGWCKKEFFNGFVVKRVVEEEEVTWF